jgi:outer membrane protein TolC
MATHTPPSRPGVDPKIKGRYMLAMVKRMERLAKPLGLKVKIESLDDLKAFLNKLLQLQTDKRIEPQESRTLNDICETLRKIYQPSDLEETVDELLKETQALRERVADIRKSGSDQSGARGGTQPDPSGSSLTGREVQRESL